MRTVTHRVPVAEFGNWCQREQRQRGGVLHLQVDHEPSCEAPQNTVADLAAGRTRPCTCEHFTVTIQETGH